MTDYITILVTCKYVTYELKFVFVSFVIKMVLKYNYLVSFDDTLVGDVATTSYSIKNESKVFHSSVGSL